MLAQRFPELTKWSSEARMVFQHNQVLGMDGQAFKLTHQVITGCGPLDDAQEDMTLGQAAL